MHTVRQLPFTPPWRWAQFHQYFSLRLMPGVETLTEERYARTLSVHGRSGWLSVRPARTYLELSVSESLCDQMTSLTALVRRVFDLDTDPATLARHFANDPQLGPLVVATPGLRLPSAFDPFEVAVRAIVGQQVSVKAAVTITRRLIERLGQPITPLPEAPELRWLFPTAQAISNASLEAIGMPGKRVAALQHLAGAVSDGSLILTLNQSVEDLVERLCQLPGVGPWTAEYIALRGFAAPDAFPAGDLGLLRAPVWGDAGISAKALTARAEAWRPWRAYAAMHLWHAYASAEPRRARIKVEGSVPTDAPAR
ncbi:DNA-3-methyladenine glycosylase family protein [Stutzerimonas marianensis]